jgi:hypothetical protein
MNEATNNAYLSDCHNSLISIVKRLYAFSKNKGNETFTDIKFDFEALQAEFQDFSFGLDAQDQRIQRFTGTLEIFEELFKKVDEMMPL